jgi:hypothetical protein
LATTCNKKEQRQDAKNNVELYAVWRKKTWNTFEITNRRGRNRPIKVWLVTDDDDDDDDDDDQ